MKSTDIDLEGELALLCAVVTAARRDAQSKDAAKRRQAVTWLRAMRLPVAGPINRPRVGTSRGKAQRVAP